MKGVMGETETETETVRWSMIELLLIIFSSAHEVTGKMTGPIIQYRRHRLKHAIKEERASAERA